jgi:hypothetical protein
MFKALFEEKTIFRLTLTLFIASLLFLLIFGFSLVFSQKAQATGISIPRLIHTLLTAANKNLR